MKKKKFLKIVAMIITSFVVIFSACDPKGPAENGINRNIDGVTSTGAAIMVIDTSMVSSKLKGISTNGILSFNNLTPEDTPEKGDIICTAPSKAAPQGFLYKVKEIKKNGSETTIVTEAVIIEKVVKNASVNQSFGLIVSDMDEVEGVEIVQLKQEALNTLSGFSKDQRLTSIKIDVDIPVAISDDYTAHVKGNIELQNILHCEMDFKDFTLKHLAVSTQPQCKAKLSLEMNCDVNKEKTFHIITIKYAPVTFWAGIIPIVLSPEISIHGVITLNGNVNLEATLIDWDYSYTMGVGYDNGNFTPISENTSKPAKYLEDAQLDLGLDAELKSELQFNAQYELYNTGSYIDLSASSYAKLVVEDKSSDSNPTETFTCGIKFGAKVEPDIFSIKIEKWEHIFGSVEWEIWKKPWGLTDDNFGYFTDPRDGIIYKWVRIGTQIWMMENLRATKYNDGTDIPNVTGTWSGLTGVWCNYDNNTSYGNTYGKLYNWHAVNTGKLAPQGWHIPTDAEWTTLSNYLGGESVAGGKMKSVTGWDSPNTGATNSSGFSALPGGYRDNNGLVDLAGRGALWWSSTQDDASRAWAIGLLYNYSNLIRDTNSKNFGFSVRCVRSDAVPIAPSAIAGKGSVSANATGEVYSIDAVSGATGYNWTVPNGAAITSGQGTTSITVNFSTESGDIKVCAVNNYGNSEYISKTVKVGDDLSGDSGYFTDPRDGTTYKLVRIGTQIWMAENLRATKYNDGTAIPNVTDRATWNELTTGAWCNYDNAASKGVLYGKLYNWYAVNTGKLAPKGWRVATFGDWTDLIYAIGDNGKELRSTTGWYENGNGTDSSGFSALPGGYRSKFEYDNNDFVAVGYVSWWWSSTEGLILPPNLTTNIARSMTLFHNSCLYAVYPGHLKSYGYSVRCVKDN